MNRTSAILLFATFTAAAGQATAESPTAEQAFMGSLSRAEVQAELAAAGQAQNPWSPTYDTLVEFRSGLSRDDVRAEYLAAPDEARALSAEDSGSVLLGHDQALDTQVAGTPERAE